MNCTMLLSELGALATWCFVRTGSGSDLVLCQNGSASDLVLCQNWER
jgi:hypothetical protein